MNGLNLTGKPREAGASKKARWHPALFEQFAGQGNESF
jgi:hypothetical protein